MTGLLALDLATRTGWAFWREGWERPAYGSFRLPKTGDDVGHFLCEYQFHLEVMLTRHGPDSVVFEAPILPATTQLITARKLYGLASITEVVCRHLRYSCGEAHQQSVRRHFIGSVSRPRDEPKAARRERVKRLTIVACEERGWSPGNDDEADALAVLDYTLAKRRIMVPWGPGGLFKEEATHAGF